MREMEWNINGTDFRPVNADTIGIKLNFIDEQGNTINELTTDSIILTNEAKDVVTNHISSLGVFEGIPVTIKIDGVTLDMYVDLTDSPMISGEGDGEIEVKIKKRKSWRQFKELADNLSFEAINKTHPITTTNTDYIIVPDNQAAMFISASIGVFVLGKALYESIDAISTSSSEAVESVTPDIIITPVGPATSIKLGAILLAALKLALRIAYLIALTLLLIDMVKRWMEIVYPSVRQLKVSKITELINKGCDKLGYTFESSILSSSRYSALTILPVPIIDNSQSIWQRAFFNSFTTPYNNGYPTAMDTIPTLGSLLDALLDMFNARMFVDNGVVKMERRDNQIKVSSKRITNTLNLQDKRENRWEYNTGDAWKRYYIHYQVDQSDIHTLDIIDGTDTEYSTEPVVIQNADLVNIKGLAEVSIPFALGRRKNDLNQLEKTFSGLAKAIDTTVKIITLGGVNSNLYAKVKGRIGVTQISQQYFTTTKLLYLIGSKQPVNYMDNLRANNLWLNFHSINEVKDNFKRIYRATIPFSSSDFVALQGNNYVYDEEQNLLELLNFEWLNQSKTAQIEYAQLSNEGDNTQTVGIDTV